MSALRSLGKVLSTDLLIVGGGIGGLSAAIAAKEASRETDVLIKDSVLRLEHQPVRTEEPMGTVLLAEKSDGVATLTLNRPEVKNALNKELRTAIVDGLMDADADPEVGAVILTGAGNSFCSGADLGEFKSSLDRPISDVYRQTADSFQLYQQVQNMSKPVIAQVNGYALAGGCGLAISCDLTIASDQSQFGFTEIQHGMVAALVATHLSRLAGRKRALELLLRGNKISAHEAFDLGLVNHVVPHDRLPDETRALALELAGKDPLALQLTKSLFYAVAESPMAPAMQSARAVNVLVRQNRSFADGINRFLKR